MVIVHSLAGMGGGDCLVLLPGHFTALPDAPGFLPPLSGLGQ